MSEFDLTKPQSRSEKIMGKMTKDYSGELDPPQSRVEAYLSKLSEGGGGTGGGSSDGDYVTIGLGFKGNGSDVFYNTFIITKNKMNSIDEIETIGDLYGSGYYFIPSLLSNFETIRLPKSNDVYFVYFTVRGKTNIFFKVAQFIPDKDKIVEISKPILYGFTLNKTGIPYKSHIEWDLNEDGCQNTNGDTTQQFTMDLTTGKPNYGMWKDAFFMPRSCMLRSDGTVAYYLDENDETKKEDGTPSDVGNPDFDGNAMMEFGRDGKLIWTKVELVPDSIPQIFKVFIADRQLDDNYHAWAFHDANGKLVPHFYMPKYNSTLINGKYRSLSGQAKDTASGATFDDRINYAKANGSGWFTETKAQDDLINILLMLMSRSLNLTDVYGGIGVIPGSSNEKTGYTNGKGMFYGTSNGVGVKVFGMENWWGDRIRAYAGHMLIDGVQKIKLTYGTEDGSTVVGYNTTGEGYTSLDGLTFSDGKKPVALPNLRIGHSIEFTGIPDKGTFVPSGEIHWEDDNSSYATNNYQNLIAYGDVSEREDSSGTHYVTTGSKYAITGAWNYFNYKNGNLKYTNSLSIDFTKDASNQYYAPDIDTYITCTPAINELDIEDKYVESGPV